MKRLVALSLLITISSFLCASLFLIFVYAPEQKSEYFQRRAFGHILQAHSMDASQSLKNQAITEARNSLLNALAHDPYNELLWIRFVETYNENSSTLESVAHNQKLMKAARVAALLRPKNNRQAQRLKQRLKARQP